jgi:hypothetical protein
MSESRRSIVLFVGSSPDAELLVWIRPGAAYNVHTEPGDYSDDSLDGNRTLALA